MYFYVNTTNYFQKKEVIKASPAETKSAGACFSSELHSEQDCISRSFHPQKAIIFAKT